MTVTRFGQIKRECYFWYRSQQWKRTRGRFAVPVRLIGMGGYEIYFDIDTPVMTQPAPVK